MINHRQVLITLAFLLVALNVWAADQIADVTFEEELVDSLGNASFQWTTGVTYVAGHTGYAARSSHNDDDGNDEDFNISCAFPASGKMYISKWLKYESGYDGDCDGEGTATWNIKQFWANIDGNGSSDMEMAIYSFGETTATWYVQWTDQLTSDYGVSETANFTYTRGDWMHVEIYIQYAAGANASSLTITINDNEIADWAFTSGVTWVGATISSPSIKASCDCATGKGWWQIDDFEVWDGLPDAEPPAVSGNGVGGNGVSNSGGG